MQRNTVPGQVAAVMPCVGCGGVVPEAPGTTHPYMQASPGCWEIYGAVASRWHEEPAACPARWHHVDAYAVQHPDRAEHDRRQRQSIAVHLISLCSLLELGEPPELAPARRGRTSQVVLARLGLDDWPLLVPPRHRGAVTVADIHAVGTPEERQTLATAWLESAWAAWASHHPTVRAWAAAMQEARP